MFTQLESTWQNVRLMLFSGQDDNWEAYSETAFFNRYIIIYAIGIHNMYFLRLNIEMKKAKTAGIWLIREEMNLHIRYVNLIRVTCNVKHKM
jgi:hypothetical protein